jgi:GTPase SAR1 family protein
MFMNGYSFPKSGILQINADVGSLFSAAKSIPGLEDYTFGDWEKTCAALPGQLEEETIRVAVIGAIKSGKSTFLNCLLKGDFLKRGAGVVTSIVTRVRSGDRARATLFYKSWAEVNEDLQQALVLFPSPHWRSGEGPFDIRRERERNELQQALDALNDDQRISDDARNRDMVLLSCYLKGYDTVRRFLTDHQATQHYEAEGLSEHWKFSGNESLAVYVKDIQLDIDSGVLGSNIEIADCQGSDSSNPLHLAMIQDYLRLAHLLIYVISSRTGLRRADIKFLSMIKKMGILDNILFVLNCDFNEHQSIEDLKSLAARVGDELALIKPRPDLYVFSALFNLFVSLDGRLSVKDRRRLEQWKTETDLLSFSEQEMRRFASAFSEILEHKRYTLLFQNPIERLHAIATGMANWIGVNLGILSRDASSAQEIAGRIRKHQQRFGQILSALLSSLSGVVPKIKQDIGGDVNRFLDSGSGEIIKAINAFIAGYRFAPEIYTEHLQAAGFSQTLYYVFQQFKQALDGFITEHINPDIVRFVASEEAKVRDAVETIASPYKSLIEDAYTEFCDLMKRLGFSMDSSRPEASGVPSIATLLRSSGLSQPSLSTTIGYTARIRTEAILKRGFYRAVSGVKRVLKKPVISGEEDLRALQQAMIRIKRETQQSLVFHLKDYQENLKFKYLFSLTEAVVRRLSQAISEQLQVYSADFGALADRLSTRQGDKERAAAVLADMDARCRRISDELDRLKQTVSTPA